MKIMIVIISVIFGFACQSEKKPREMTALEVYGQLKNDFCVLIDIRETGSYSKTAESAFPLPLSEIEKNTGDIKSLLKDNISNKSIVLFSNNTESSIKACAIFLKADIECNYLADFSKWEEENLPTRNL